MTSVVLKDKSSVGKTATMEAKKATEGLALGILDTARGNEEEEEEVVLLREVRADAKALQDDISKTMQEVNALQEEAGVFKCAAGATGRGKGIYVADECQQIVGPTEEKKKT
ncbi:hypothetical protein Tc00.1047053510595.30 [Trypanosoma cruzi]|uniref:Uncharacterized protein n=1 Tax=Trypanosoma cruzi (strain CL Brener) TaxID=353153 RepID=Q4CUW2_TRYCC|nr:hypothetical protein Tc00.1047053510595.30 [Trypanosoma cruzi]EAN84063.1 hypothetical protein Tc00.1047053510595.30 [Trypanosoma cruzi]|eukprot:XP_805914.1 hypothetical protein [Trypanosoma cruzi strain CL Brener]